MKKYSYKLGIPLVLGTLVIVYACNKSFLNKPLLGQVQATSLANKAGVEGLLIGAYSLLDGVGAAGTTGVPGLIAPSGSGGIWEDAADDWIFSSVPGGDDHKGSFVQDQGAYFLPVQAYSEDPSNLYLDDKWITVYASIQRCNDVLRTMALVSDGSLSPADTVEIRAEAVFLRGIYHLEGKKMWNNIPYIDETIDLSNNNYLVSNTIDAWPKIEADFNYAIAHLPAIQTAVGRGNSWAAKAFLAKCYMFEHKFTDAAPLLDDLIANGVTPNGLKYALLSNYFDNFNAAHKNDSESIFAAQSSVHDNAQGENGNPGDVLNYPYGGPTSCCGFFQPSYSLVNSFKTDPTTGLPLIDTYNNSDLKSDEGVPNWNYTYDSKGLVQNPDTFHIDAQTVDPRLDWSVGRRGVPYLDWGLPPGAAWIREQSTAGPYLPMKAIVSKAQQTSYGDQYGGWAPNQSTADNYVYIRFANVLLWRAECYAQASDLANATAMVNLVRARAANPATWVKKYNINTYGAQDPTLGFSNVPAANYKIGLYPTFPDQATALKDIYFETKLELSSEGMRFFDLVRWGIAATELNAYIAHETGYNHSFNLDVNTGGGTFYYPPLTSATFTAGRSEYYPIPQPQIDASAKSVGAKSSLTQNPGY